MVNRRLLRIKAMQAIYAFHKAQASDFYAAKDLIGELYKPDYSVLEQTEIDKILAEQTAAEALFSSSYDSGILRSIDTLNKNDVLQKAVAHYTKEQKKDKNRIAKAMVDEVEDIYRTYYFILQFLLELSDYTVRYAEKQRERKVGAQQIPEHELKLRHNKVLSVLREDAFLKKEWEKYPFDWQENKETIKEFFIKTMLKDEEYVKYAQLEKADFATDKAAVLHISKKLLFNNEVLDDHFETRDIYWSENKSVVKSMVAKTIKGIEKGAQAAPRITISTDWEEDKAFFQRLYSDTVDNNEELEMIIVDRLKNWDIDRVALIDKILLKMAITEMMNFTSIPVKVTINEYIEISKRYSTPKSKQFVNGILDKISEELVEQGKIRKSGRGLIDNK